MDGGGLEFTARITAGDIITWGTVLLMFVRFSNRFSIMESRVKTMWVWFIAKVGNGKHRAAGAGDNGDS